MVGRARAITGGQAFVPFNVGGTAATLDLDFRNGGYVGIAGVSSLTSTRTGPSTSARPSDATGSSYTSFAPNTARIVSGTGLIMEATATQYLGVTDTPATQTTSSLGTGTYTLWVIGSGSATPSAGTATITGAAAATAGSPNTFTVTVAGTVTVTVSGSLSRFSLTNEPSVGTYIPNHGAAGTTVVRGDDTLVLSSLSWMTQNTGTFYVEFVPYFVTPSGYNASVFMVTDAGITNRMNAFMAAGTPVMASRITTAGVNAHPGNTANSATANATNKYCLAYAVNDAASVLNGGTVATSTPASYATVATYNSGLFIGTGTGGTSPIRGVIRRLAYFPARLSNAQLQTLTG